MIYERKKKDQFLILEHNYAQLVYVTHDCFFSYNLILESFCICLPVGNKKKGKIII